MSKISALTEGTSIVATDLFRFVDVSDTTMAASGTNKKATAVTLINELAQLISPTWNNAGTDFTALKVNVTNTASGASSRLIDLQVGGVSQFSVAKDGSVIALGTGVNRIRGETLFITDSAGNGQKASISSSGFFIDSTLAFNFGGNVLLYATSAGILAQRNSTNAQEFRLYNTYDGTNDEWIEFKWNTNVFSFTPKASGTGTTRVIHISGLPTSNPGPGILWNNAGTPAIGT